MSNRKIWYRIGCRVNSWWVIEKFELYLKFKEGKLSLVFLFIGEINDWEKRFWYN